LHEVQQLDSFCSHFTDS